MSNLNWSKPQSLDYIPEGKLVTFTALHQALYTQYVQIIDSAGAPIAFNTLAGQAAQFPISGSGTVVGFLNNGAGCFYMRKGHQIQFANSGGQTSLPLMSSPSLLYINGQNFGGGAFFGVEDQGGTDYNDTSFNLQWYTYEG